MKEFICLSFRLLWLALVSLTVGATRPSVDIVITLKTDIFWVKQVVTSLLKHAPDENSIGQRIIFVDDGSPLETIEYTSNLCKTSQEEFICLYTTKEEPGYTYAVNLGINYGHNHSEAIVLLNSDTQVTQGWLPKLYDALFNGDPKIRVVGPLSNAASFQSVPELKDEKTGDWSTNIYPPGIESDDLARNIEEYATTHNLKPAPLMVLNGFCYMFRRQLIKEIGGFDTVNFPAGYGEEVDFSLRIYKAGFKQVIIPSVYVYHKKTASFSPVNKKELKKTSRNFLKKTYGRELLDKINADSLTPELDGVRNFTDQMYNDKRAQLSHLQDNATIMFVLNDLSYGNIIRAVLQETWNMRKFGVNVSVAFSASMKAGHAADSSVIRSLLPDANDDEIKDIFKSYTKTPVNLNGVSRSLINIAKDYNILVGSSYKVMETVQEIKTAHPQIMPAYQVQVNSNEELAESGELYKSGTSFMMSRTLWTVKMLKENYNSSVNLLSRSLDHSVFYPNMTEFAKKMKKSDKSVLNIVTIVKPKILRRNPLSTLEVSLRLAYNYPDKVHVTLFGCDEQRLDSAMNKLVLIWGKGLYRSRTFELLKLKNVEFKGVLRGPMEIASLFRMSDVFFDMSWWREFDQTALEAMATGMVAIVPAEGDAREICKNDEKYCLYHDPLDMDGYYKKIESLVQNNQIRRDLIVRGINKMSHISTAKAAATLAHQLKRGYSEFVKNGYSLLQSSQATESVKKPKKTTAISKQRRRKQ